MKSSTSHWLGAILLSFLALGVNLKAQNATNTAGTTGQQRPHFLRQLDLSDAQKAQIKAIVQSTPRGKERRQEILAVLTPEQKAQLKQDFEQWKAQHQRP
jgi:Spy/CpxP family protein refolding chaperone